MIQTSGALLSTEITKLKHTSTLWVSILVPISVLAMALLELLATYSHWGSRAPRAPADEWNMVLTPWWMIWTWAVVPILIGVEAVGLVSPEHAGKHWKQLYTMPIPRWSIFAAKAAVCWLMVGVSFLIFAAGMLGLGLLRSGLLDLHMASGIPWGLMLRLLGRAFLASSAAVAIQVWLSMRFAGFTIPLGAGLAATIMGGFIVSQVHQIHLTGWWPWMMPFDSLPWGMDHVPASLVVSPLVFLVLSLAAGWRLSNSEIV